MKMYVKEGFIRDKAKISVIRNGMRIFNPKEELLFEDGWEIYTHPIQEPIEIPYKQRVIELIREKYSIDDELAVSRQRDSKIDEFKAYNSFVEECKQQAREELGL